jgi:hypothetical protein
MAVVAIGGGIPDRPDRFTQPADGVEVAGRPLEPYELDVDQAELIEAEVDEGRVVPLSAHRRRSLRANLTAATVGARSRRWP